MSQNNAMSASEIIIKRGRLPTSFKFTPEAEEQIGMNIKLAYYLLIYFSNSRVRSFKI